MRNKKIFFLVLIAAGLLVGLFWFWQKGQAAAVKASTVKRQTLVETVSASGVTDSTQKETIFAPLNGRVQTVYLAEGSKVSAGDKIAELDKVPFELAKNQAWANYTAARLAKEQAFKASPLFEEFQAAKAASDAAQFSLDQAQKTYHDDPSDTHKSLLNTAYASYQSAWSKVKRLQNQMIGELQIQNLEAAQYAALTAYQKAQDDLAKTVILARQDGTLIYKANPATAAKIKAGQTVSVGQPMFAVASLEKMEFVASLDEADLGRVKLGQRVQISLDAEGNEVFTGQVSFVAPSAQLDAGGQRVFEVKISLDNLPHPLNLGLSGSAQIEVAKKQDVLAIPQEAFFFKDEAEWVWVVAKGKVKKQKVELGQEAGGLIEVQGGLTQGEVVVTAPIEKLKSGQRVQISGQK